MSPENAQVFFVEDDAESLETNMEFLEAAGHKVVVTASSLPEALSKIPDLRKKGVNVAIIDGNLSEMDESGQDREKVASAIKAQHPYVIIIGHALKKLISAADINCPKLEGASKLTDTVTQS